MALPRKLRTKIEPAFDGPLIDNRHVKATMFIKKTKSQRNAIGLLYRQLDIETTTLCFVEADNIIYKLISNPSTSSTTDTNWAPLSLASSALIPIGNWDADNTTPVLQDSDAAGRTGQFYFVVGAPTATVVAYPGLFGGAAVTVSDGMYIVSVGSAWIVVSNATTWDSIAKPSVIADYVNGTVIAHNQAMSTITGLIDALDTKYDVTDTAPHDIDFNLVSDEAIVEVEFLREWYYTKTDIEQLIEDLEDGGITTFLGLLDTPDTYTGNNLKFVRVNTVGNALEFTSSAGLFWHLTGSSDLVGNTTIDIDNFELDIEDSATGGGLHIEPTFGDVSLTTGRILSLGTPVSGSLTIDVGSSTFTSLGGSSSSSTFCSLIMSSTFTKSSGTNDYTTLALSPIYNFTGGARNVFGIDYNPTLTSMTSITHIAARFNSGNVQVNNGFVLVKGSSSDAINIEHTSLVGTIKLYLSSANQGTLFFNQNGEIKFQQSTSSTAAGAIRISNFQTFTTTTGTATEFGVGSTFAPASGNGNYNTVLLSPSIAPTGTTTNANYISLNMTPTVNFTVGTNTLTGIDYNPTISGVIGLDHRAAWFRRGRLTFGTSTTVGASIFTSAGASTQSDEGFAMILRTLANNNNQNHSHFWFIGGGSSQATAAGTMMTITNSFIASSSNPSYTHLSLIPTYNTTSTYNGTAIGIDYNPTLTSTIGLTHVAIRVLSGQVLLGGTSVTTDTRLDIRGLSSGNILYGANSSGTIQRFRFTDDGAFILGTDSDGTTITTGTRTLTIAGVSNYGAAAQFTFSAGANNLTSGTAVVVDYAGNTINPSSGNGSVIFARITGNLAPTGTTSGGFYTSLRINPTYNFTVGTSTVYGIDYDPSATSMTGVTLYGLLIRPSNSLNGFGLTSPTALLDIDASSSTRSGLRVRPGTAPSSPNNGDLWIDSVAHSMHARINSVSKSLLFTESNVNIGFFGVTAISQRTSGANLTNNVTSGGTDDVIANITDLSDYATDSSNIKNNIYQLARKLKQINDGLRAYGLFT